MKISWTKPADADLDHIEDSIKDDNPRAAVKTVLKIIESVEKLVPSNPAIGRHGRIHGTRELVISQLPYIVMYRVQEKTIEVLRVLHCSQKWPDLFEGIEDMEDLKAVEVYKAKGQKQKMLSIEEVEKELGL